MARLLLCVLLCSADYHRPTNTLRMQGTTKVSNVADGRLWSTTAAGWNTNLWQWLRWIKCLLQTTKTPQSRGAIAVACAAMWSSKLLTRFSSRLSLLCILCSSCRRKASSEIANITLVMTVVRASLYSHCYDTPQRRAGVYYCVLSVQSTLLPVGVIRLCDAIVCIAAHTRRYEVQKTRARMENVHAITHQFF